MRAALYIRVSSVGQARDGYSLDFQEQILREFCEREGHVVVETYKDGGASGSNMQRKDLIRLIDDAKQRSFDIVLIFRVDRFSRDPVDLLALVRQLEKSQIKLRSVTEAVDASDPAGELMLTILGAIGKFVRSNIIQNAMLGKTKRAQAGKYTGGKIPFGYVVGEDGRYLPDHSEWVPGMSKAQLIRKCFDLYAESFSTGKPGSGYVIRWFEDNGIPSPDAKGWTRTTLIQMLRHDVYTGTFVYAKKSQPQDKPVTSTPKEQWVMVPDAHEPLVPLTLFDAVQELKERNRSGGGPSYSGKGGGLLSGFMACAVCGSSLTLRKANGGINRYYVCGSRLNDTRVRRGTACMDFPLIRAELLENFVWEQIEQVAEDEETLQDLMNQYQTGPRSQLEQLTAEHKSLTRRLSDLEDEEMTVTTAYAQKRMPPHLWEKQIARLEEDRSKVMQSKRKVESELRNLSRHPALVLDLEQVRNYLRRMFKGGLLDFQDKRRALGLLVQHKGIRVSPQGDVKITLQFPLNEVACALDMTKLEAVTRHN